MVRCRAFDERIERAIGCHTFRAAGITDYLTNGVRIEVAKHLLRTATRLSIDQFVPAIVALPEREGCTLLGAVTLTALL
jgi:hypothetical protein